MDTANRDDIRMAIMKTMCDVAKDTDPSLAMLGLLIAIKVDKALFDVKDNNVTTTEA